jgi:hypothetical protein
MTEAPGGTPEAIDDLTVADRVPSIDVDSFDITVAGWLVGETGPIKHNVTFNAYKVLSASYERRGLSVEPAELIYDALRIVHDHERLRAIEDLDPADRRSGRVRVALRKFKGDRRPR